jgi:hypothetical protein
MVMNSGVRRELAAESERFTGHVTPESGDVLVFGRFPGSSRYQALLKYHAR